jgi:hypothetical protein
MDTKWVTVDFVFPEKSEGPDEAKKFAVISHPLGRCPGCGGERYTLASEMGGDRTRGIPASRMFECLDCGTYRLG